MAKGVIKYGYLVEFCVRSNGSVFCDTLEAAKYTRDAIAGGGLIYHATIEKIGSNCFPVRGAMARKCDGTPI